MRSTIPAAMAGTTPRRDRSSFRVEPAVLTQQRETDESVPSDLVEYRGGVTADWAAAVVRGVHRSSLDVPPPTIDETWLDAELVLYVRYRLGRKKLAARFRLDVDPVTGGAPTDADELATALFHCLRSGGPGDFVDPNGYRWWGHEPPDADWVGALLRVRIMTIS
jgi:hypothetical protein